MSFWKSLLFSFLFIMGTTFIAQAIGVYPNVLSAEWWLFAIGQLMLFAFSIHLPGPDSEERR